jgi:hypothetical protein
LTASLSHFRPWANSDFDLGLDCLDLVADNLARGTLDLGDRKHPLVQNQNGHAMEIIDLGALSNTEL